MEDHENSIKFNYVRGGYLSVFVRSIYIFVFVIISVLLLSACSDQLLDDPLAALPPASSTTPGYSNEFSSERAEGTSLEYMTETDSPSGSLTLATGVAQGYLASDTVLETEQSLAIDRDPETVYANSEHTLRADFLKTGKSDAILLRMDSKTVMIDTGDSNDYDAICKKLEKYGINKIDVMIISHFDNDHVGSASRLVSAYDVAVIYVPDYVRTSVHYQNLMNAVESKDGAVELIRVTEDVHLDLGYGSLWINPTKLYSQGEVIGSGELSENIEENNFSLITTVKFGNTSLLFTGDAERERMEEFLAYLEANDENENIKYTLVKMPHHGSYTKGMGAFLDVAKPRYCVICAGSDTNIDSSTVTKMKAVGAGVYYTYNGDVYFVTNGTSNVVIQN